MESPVDFSPEEIITINNFVHSLGILKFFMLIVSNINIVKTAENISYSKERKPKKTLKIIFENFNMKSNVCFK